MNTKILGYVAFAIFLTGISSVGYLYKRALGDFLLIEEPVQKVAIAPVSVESGQDSVWQDQTFSVFGLTKSVFQSQPLREIDRGAVVTTVYLDTLRKSLGKTQGSLRIDEVRRALELMDYRPATVAETMLLLKAHPEILVDGKVKVFSVSEMKYGKLDYTVQFCKLKGEKIPVLAQPCAEGENIFFRFDQFTAFAAVPIGKTVALNN